jgi:site-specific recombinase XerD
VGKPDAGKLARPVWRGLGGNVFRKELRAALPPYAKNLANQEVGLEKIASLLGHANLNTTQIYLVPDARDLEQAVGKLENY